MNKAKHSFAVLVLVLLCFCGGCGKEGGESDSSVPAAFRAVLLNEATFFCTDKFPESNRNAREFEGLLSEMPYGYDYARRIDRFAVVDLDGDAIPEVVLELAEYG